MSGASFWLTMDKAGFHAVWLLVSTLWQSSILLLAAGIVAYFLRRRRAAIRHAVWAAALLVLPLIPVLGWAASRAQAPQATIPVVPAYTAPRVAAMPQEAPPAFPAIVSPRSHGPVAYVPPSEPVPATRHPAAQTPDPAPTAVKQKPATPEKPFSLFDYPWAIGFVSYGSGALAFILFVIIGRLRIGRWASRGRVVTDSRVLGVFQAAGKRLGLERDFSLVESPSVPSPMAVRVFHPVVIMPERLAQDLSQQDLHAVALHELAHIKRHDALLLTLLSFVRAAFFFHPLVWLACRQASALAESACDDAVLDTTGEPVSYAKMLARLAEDLPRHALGTELAAGIVLSKGAFLRRIEAILSDRRNHLRKLSRMALATTVLAAVLSVALALSLPLGEKKARGSSTQPGSQLATAPVTGPASPPKARRELVFPPDWDQKALRDNLKKGLIRLAEANLPGYRILDSPGMLYTIMWKTQEARVTGQVGKGPGAVIREHTVEGPADDGLIVGMTVGGIRQKAMTYLIKLPKLNDYLLVDVQFGSKIDPKLREMFSSPQAWIDAAQGATQPATAPATKPAMSDLATKLVAKMPMGWKLTGHGQCESPTRWSLDPALGKSPCEYVSFRHDTAQAIFPPGPAAFTLWIMPADYVGRLYETNLAQRGGASLSWAGKEQLLFIQGGNARRPEDWTPVDELITSLGFEKAPAVDISPAAAKVAKRVTSHSADDKDKRLPGFETGAAAVPHNQPGKFAFNAVAKATNDPLVIPHRSGTAYVSQWFQFTQGLAGDADTREDFPYPLSYTIQSKTERPILKDEQVILVVRIDNSELFAVQALPDTPEYRKAATDTSTQPAAQDHEKDRDKLLAEADETLRQGLKELSKRFGQLGVANNQPLDKALAKARPVAGKLSLWFGRSNKPLKSPWKPEEIADDQAWSLMAILEPHDTGNDRAGEGRARAMTIMPLYPHVRLGGQCDASAADPKLDQAIKKLLADALSPLKQFDEQAAKGQPATAPATQRAVRVAKAGQWTDWTPENNGLEFRVKSVQAKPDDGGLLPVEIEIRNVGKVALYVVDPDKMRDGEASVLYRPGVVRNGRLQLLNTYSLEPVMKPDYFVLLEPGKSLSGKRNILFGVPNGKYVAYLRMPGGWLDKGAESGKWAKPDIERIAPKAWRNKTWTWEAQTYDAFIGPIEIAQENGTDPKDFKWPGPATNLPLPATGPATQASKVAWGKAVNGYQCGLFSPARNEVGLVVRNDSQKELTFRNFLILDRDRITVSQYVEMELLDADGKAVKSLCDFAKIDPLRQTLKPGHAYQYLFDIRKAFDITKKGTYRLGVRVNPARVREKEWVESAELEFQADPDGPAVKSREGPQGDAPATGPASAWLEEARKAIPKGWSLKPVASLPGVGRLSPGEAWTVTRDEPIRVMYSSPVGMMPEEQTFQIVFIAGPKVSSDEYRRMVEFNKALEQKFRGNEATLRLMGQLLWWDKRTDGTANRPYLLPTHVDNEHSLSIACAQLASGYYEFKAKEDKAQAANVLAAIAARFQSHAAAATRPAERYFTTMGPGDELCNAKKEIAIGYDVALPLFYAKPGRLADGWEKLLPSNITPEADARALPDLAKIHGQPPTSTAPYAHVAGFSDTHLLIRISRPGGSYLWHHYEDNIATFVVPQAECLYALFGLEKLKKEFAVEYRGLRQGDSYKKIIETLGQPERTETTQAMEYSYLYYAGGTVRIDIWKGQIWRIIIEGNPPAAATQPSLPGEVTTGPAAQTHDSCANSGSPD